MQLPSRPCTEETCTERKLEALGGDPVAHPPLLPTTKTQSAATLHSSVCEEERSGTLVVKRTFYIAPVEPWRAPTQQRAKPLLGTRPWSNRRSLRSLTTLMRRASEITIETEATGVVFSTSGRCHHPCLLVFANTLLEEIRLALQGDQLHPVEGIADIENLGMTQ